MPTESELKIPVADLAVVRGRLAERGGHRLHGAVREENQLFDRADGELSRRGVVLRLRRTGDRSILTFKGPARFRGAIKERSESEVVIDDPLAVVAILEGLGLAVTRRYEKDREEWSLDGVTVCLDATPMGSFVELEGPPEQLTRIGTAIGLDVGAAVDASYIRLWRDYRQRHPELVLPEDMVFRT